MKLALDFSRTTKHPRGFWQASFCLLTGLLFSLTAQAESWKIVNSGTANDITGITWDGSRFIAVDSGGGILESANGSYWYRTQTESWGFSQIVAGNGHYVAIQDGYSAYFHSSDRLTWQETDPGLPSGLIGGTFNAGKFTLVGGEGLILNSTDALTWELFNSGATDSDLNRVAFGNGLYVAVGEDGIFISQDTLSWTPQGKRNLSGYSDIAYYNGRYVATTDIDSFVCTSTDGINWKETEIETWSQSFPNLPAWGNAVCGGPAGFKIVCDDGRAFSTKDGQKLEEINMSSTSKFNDVAYGGGVYVAVGDSGLIRTFIPSGTTTTPEIQIQQPKGSTLTNKKTKKSFGTVAIGKKGPAKTFTIKNIGSANLTGLVLTKTGAAAKDFTLTKTTRTSLAQNGTTSFKITFAPKGKGVRNAVLKIESNDADDNPFEIKLTGLGIK